MSDLEKRLQDALAAQAGRIEPTEDAWAQHQQSIGATPNGRIKRLVPILIAAVVVAIAVGATVLLTRPTGSPTAGPAAPIITTDPTSGVINCGWTAYAPLEGSAVIPSVPESGSTEAYGSDSPAETQSSEASEYPSNTSAAEIQPVVTGPSTAGAYPSNTSAAETQPPVTGPFSASAYPSNTSAAETQPPVTGPFSASAYPSNPSPAGTQAPDPACPTHDIPPASLPATTSPSSPADDCQDSSNAAEGMGISDLGPGGATVQVEDIGNGVFCLSNGATSQAQRVVGAAQPVVFLSTTDLVGGKGVWGITGPDVAKVRLTNAATPAGRTMQLYELGTRHVLVENTKLPCTLTFFDATGKVLATKTLTK